MVRNPFIALALLTCITASPACAVEAGMSPYTKGLAGFMSGLMPPQQGVYLTNIYYHYNGTAGADVRGGVVELNAGINLDVDLVEGLYVSDTKIFGAQYAVGGAVGYGWAGLDAQIETPLARRDISLSNADVTDSLFLPMMLGWHDGNLHWALSTYIYVPTGHYSTTELSLGKNIWAFMPQFAMTYFDPKSGLDVSGALTYVTMTRNDATDYQSGDILHLDWAIGMHLEEWEIGIAGNVMQQVGDDSGTGAKLGPNRAFSAGIGPEVNYTTVVSHTPLVFAVKWEHDFAAQHTFEDGDIVAFTATVGL